MNSSNDSWLGIKGVPWAVAVFLNFVLIALIIYGIVAFFNNAKSYHEYTITYSFQDQASGTDFKVSGDYCISAHESYNSIKIIERFLLEEEVPTGSLAPKAKISLKPGCSGSSRSNNYRKYKETSK